MTVSVGVASCGKTTGTYRVLVEKADAALYQVKRSGKNRVVMVADEGVELECAGSGCPTADVLLYISGATGVKEITYKR